jgi:hypothetical protein
MRNTQRVAVFATSLICVLCAAFAMSVRAGSHTWDVNEVFVNGDGSIWFIELREVGGGNNENGVGGHDIISLDTLASFQICCNVVGDTGLEHLLFGNQAFADLPGAPPPDQIVNINAFFDVTGDTLRYNPWDNLVFPALPNDGINSFNEVTGVAVNSPTNFAGTTGSVDASGGGASGSVVLTMNRTSPPLPMLVLNWTISCEPADTAVGVYRGTLVSLLGGTPPPTYNHAMVQCNVGGSSTSVPQGFGDQYFLVVPSGPAREGSYGRDLAGGGSVERPQGTGACRTQEISCP